MAKPDKGAQTVTVSNRTLIRIIIFVLLAFLAVGFIAKIATALKLIFISGFLALALNPAVSWISKSLPSKSRVRATAVAYLIVISALVGFSAIVVPPLVKQTIEFADTIPLSVNDIENQDTPLVHFIERHNFTRQYTQAISEIKENLNHATGRIYSLATVIGGGLAAAITVLVMAFMMLVEGPVWMNRLIALQPKGKIKKRRQFAEEMYRMVTGYVNGQLVVAFIAATFAFFALIIASTILDANINPIALAAIVGVIGLIPMIGNTLAAVVVVLFCLFASLPLAIIMAVFFLVYQQVENATLQPYIQSRYNELTPLTVFIAAIIGVSVAGFLGALVAIPLAGCIRIYLKMFYGDKLMPESRQGSVVSKKS